MRIESIKVLAQLFYSRAIGRLGLGPDPMGYGYGNLKPDELQDVAPVTEAPADEPTLPKMQLAPPSFPRASARFDDLNNQAAACKADLKKFIKENINEKNINAKNVRYVHDMLMSINASLEMVTAALEPGWGDTSTTLRDCLEQLHEANLQMSGRHAVKFMQFKNFDVLQFHVMGVIDVLDKVVYEMLSSPEAIPQESVA